MTKAQPGTSEWFAETRLALLESTRATQSLNLATEAASALVSKWNDLDQTLCSALVVACIINYCRPFVDRQTSTGTRRYRLKNVAHGAGFDMPLHRHLLQVRHKMVAHSDEDFLDAKIHAQTALISNGDREIKLIAELGARSVAMWLVRERTTAEKWLAHIKATVVAAGAHAAKTLEAYFQAARDFPDNCPLLVVEGAEKLAEFRAEVKAGETISLRLPSMPMNDLKVPPLTEERGAYLFQVLSLVTRGSGTTVRDLGDGWLIETGRPQTAGEPN